MTSPDEVQPDAEEENSHVHTDENKGKQWKTEF